MISIKDMMITAVLAVCTAGAMIGLSMQEAHARGASAGGRGGSVSVSRSSSGFSSSRPSVTRTTSSIARTTPTVVKPVAPRPISTVKKPIVAKSATKPRPYYGSRHRDDDVECDTLRNSRYSADREVYRRYCQ